MPAPNIRSSRADTTLTDPTKLLPAYDGSIMRQVTPDGIVKEDRYGEVRLREGPFISYPCVIESSATGRGRRTYIYIRAEHAARLGMNGGAVGISVRSKCELKTYSRQLATFKSFQEHHTDWDGSPSPLWDLLYGRARPCPEKGQTPTPAVKVLMDRHYLNKEQAEVVSWIKGREGYHYFSLVQGPPDTGKTKTCCAIILEHLKARPGSRVLVVSPQNQAVDELASRYLRLKGQPADKSGAVRIGRPDSIRSDVKCIYVDTLVKRRIRNRSSILSEDAVVFATTSGADIHESMGGGFELCIIDEAVHCTEADIAVPIARRASHYVLVGAYPSLNYYDGLLRSDARNDIQGNAYSQLSAIFSPVRFYEVDAKEIREGTNYYNDGEIRAFTKALQYMNVQLKKPEAPKGAVSIAIISAYASQVDKLRLAVEGSPGIPDVFHTIDNVQGGQADSVILSFTRTAGKASFMEDQPRLNVALSRAKMSLLIFACFRNFVAEAPLVCSLIKSLWSEGLHQAYHSEMFDILDYVMD